VNDLVALWASCSSILRQRLPEPTWNTWLAPLTPIEATEDTLTFAVPNAMVRDTVSLRYLDLIRAALKQTTGAAGLASISFVIQPSAFPQSTVTTNEAVELSSSVLARPSAPESFDTNTITPHHYAANNHDASLYNKRYTFASYVVGPSNRFAQAAALAVAERPGGAYNPLFLYGATGLGKTHLLHATANYVTEHFPRLTVRYVSIETFLSEFIDAIHKTGPSDFKRRYRGCDVLLVDDIHFIRGKETQEEFVHTLDSLHQAGKQIVISSDRHPTAISTVQERLRSRFVSGLITDIQPPELATRIAILRMNAQNQQVTVPADVLELIANHIKDNIRELEGALTRIVAYAKIHDVEITRELTEQVLSDVITPGPPRQITKRAILEAVSDTFGVNIEDIRGPSRRRPLVTARQVAMYLFRRLTEENSYPSIAAVFDRDHTTVIHAVDKINKLVKERSGLYSVVEELSHKLREDV